MPAPKELQVFFASHEPPLQCRSIAEMDAALDRLHEESLRRQLSSDESPLTVGVSIPGFYIYTGLGTPDSFVMLGADPNDNDEWYTAIGDLTAEGDSKRFYGVGDDSFWAPKHLVPAAVARGAVRHFAEHQERIPTLQWEY